MYHFLIRGDKKKIQTSGSSDRTVRITDTVDNLLSENDLTLKQNKVFTEQTEDVPHEEVIQYFKTTCDVVVSTTGRPSPHTDDNVRTCCTSFRHSSTGKVVLCLIQYVFVYIHLTTENWWDVSPTRIDHANLKSKDSLSGNKAYILLNTFFLTQRTQTSDLDVSTF
jgi:hypothetical protein